MKILFVWTGVTSYMADCWRRLQQLEGVDLRVVVEQVDSGKAFDAESTLSGIDYTLVSEHEPSCEAALGRILNDSDWAPDAIFAVGWHSRLVRAVVQQRNWSHIPKVCCFDMPWRWSFRCIAARWVLHPFLKRFAAAYVPGHVCATYAKWLGFSRIEKGLFAIDTLRFRRLRETAGRKGFLYVGRFSAEKRVDIVRKAHERYLSLGGTWGIDMYGQGGLFIQAGDMPRIYAEHACLVLASELDPWPLVVPEALSAGCDVVMSDRCGNRFELPGARVVHFGDVEAMAREMLNVEREWNGQNGRSAPKTAAAIQSDISPYDCRTWAERTMRLAAELAREITI